MSSIAVTHTFGQVRSGTNCATFFTSTDDDGVVYRIYIRQPLSRRRFQKRLETYQAPDAEHRALVDHALLRMSEMAK